MLRCSTPPPGVLSSEKQLLLVAVQRSWECDGHEPWGTHLVQEPLR